MLSFRLARPGCLAPSAPSAPPDVCLDGEMCLLHKDEFDEFFMSHADMNFVSPPHIHLSFRLSIPPVPAYQPAIYYDVDVCTCSHRHHHPPVTTANESVIRIGIYSLFTLKLIHNALHSVYRCGEAVVWPLMP